LIASLMENPATEEMKKLATTFALSFLLAAPFGLVAQEAPADPMVQDTEAATRVEIEIDPSRKITFYTNFGPFSPRDRSLEFRKNLEGLTKLPHLNVANLVVKNAGNHDALMYDTKIVLIVSDDDAKQAGKSRRELIREHLTTIKTHLQEIQKSRDKTSLWHGLIYTSLATLAMFGFWWGINKIWKKIMSRIDAMRLGKMPTLKLQNLEVLSADRATDITMWFAKWLRVLLILLGLYFYFPIIFSFFPWTKGLADLLFSYIRSPITSIGMGILNYVPNIFFIAVIWIFTRYINKFVKLAFDEIKRGNLKFPGFHKDWADPTYKIIRFLVGAFALVMIFPYLPGSNSPAFQGVSIFFGVLFSMGSTSAIANLVAGTVLTYMRPFQIGDRVKIADTVGDVVERNMLVTRIRTIKNVDITVANSMVLGSHIINFSSSAAKRGLILNTTVTIGYDVAWPKVHELLIAAATAVPEVENEPAPFVLQKSLDDWYVSYELNAYTRVPNMMAVIYSKIHQNIQDNFNKAGVEIMSPHFMGLRDGNAVNIPSDYLQSSYEPPAFRVQDPKKAQPKTTPRKPSSR
jgi:small-conductance mechanosensitive channel